MQNSIFGLPIAIVDGQFVPVQMAVKGPAEVGKLFADGKGAASAFGVSNVVRENPAWAEAMRATDGEGRATTRLPGLRRDLVADAAGRTQATNSRVAPESKRRFARSATLLAQKARTVAEVGHALRALRGEAGLSLNDLVDRAELERKKGAKVDGLAKSTLSSVCQGHRLFQTAEQVTEFVTFCGAGADVDVWLAAWRTAKENRGSRARGAGRPTSASAEPAAITEPPRGSGGGWWLSGPGDEVVHVIQIPVTRGQVRAAVAALAVLGLVASSTSVPAVRAAGLAGLGVAATATLVDHTQPAPAAAVDVA